MLVLASVLAAFAGGPALGVLAAHWAAPGSEVAQVVSPLAFVGAFVAGLMLWFGFGVVSVVGSALQRLLRGRSNWRDRSRLVMEPVPPGHGAFVPLAVGLGFVAGTVAGFVPQSSSFWLSCSVHVGAGAAYGGALRALARNGYLPFPEPS